MLSVSKIYKEKINAASRWIKGKVIVHFSAPINPITFEKTELVAIDALLETNTTSANPLGIVTANEITIEFDNTNGHFTPTNLQGPYYSQLNPGVKIEPFLGLVLDSMGEQVEWLPLGIFWTGDWRAPSTSTTASVCCYDRLYHLGNLEVPAIETQKDISIIDAFKTLFKALKLTESDYVIDPKIQGSIKTLFFSGTKVIDVIQQLAVAGMCSVTTDRFNRIVVKNIYRLGTAVSTFTDNDQIIVSENPQMFANIYSAVAVNYKIPAVQENQNLLQISNFYLPHGTTTFDAVNLTTKPAEKIKTIQVLGAQDVSIKPTGMSSQSISFEVLNKGDGENVTINVLGDLITTHDAVYRTQDNEAVQMYGYKELVIDNPYIQSYEMAKEYGEALRYYVSNPHVSYNLNTRGDPAIEINDLLKVEDPSGKLDEALIVINRLNLHWDGALICDITAKLPLAPKTWIMISPGFYVNTYYNYS